jgi:hypothetical protein
MQFGVRMFVGFSRSVLSFGFQQQDDSLCAARTGGRTRVERRNMTTISGLLRQKTALYRRAVEQTCDVNEAYLVVHGVMARALSGVGEADRDLGAALASALEIRSHHRMAVTP